MNSTMTGNFTGKETFKLMSCGISAIGQKPQNEMMDAIIESKKVEDQKLSIQNRLVKLRKEEEKASKRIKDLQRKQKFRENCNFEK